MNAARLELKGLAQGVHVDRLCGLADQVGLHGAGEHVVRAEVAPLGHVEVAAQLPVDAGEQVQVEVPGHALAVVVGTQQDLDVLLEVDERNRVAGQCKRMEA